MKSKNGHGGHFPASSRRQPPSWLRETTPLTDSTPVPPPRSAQVMLVKPCMEEERLRRQAQERIRQGRLPAQVPLRTWGGPGAGYPCCLCDLPITQGEIEFELQFGANPNPISLRFHSRCHVAWDLERRSLPEYPGSFV